MGDCQQKVATLVEGPRVVRYEIQSLTGEYDSSDRLLDLKRGEFHGTAFAVAPGFFVTAEHVYKTAKAAGPVALGRLRGLVELNGVPPGFEVSFVRPPGLSGAPLLQLHNVSIFIRGVVLTHHSAQLGDRRKELGIAVDIQELLTLESRIVEGPIAEKLFGLEQLPPRNRQP